MYLCRHGQTDWNAAKKIQGSVDRELNELGERQALLIGEALKSVDRTLVASSPLSRAFRTADLAMSVACPDVEGVRIHPGLREMNFGELEGAVAAESELYSEVNAAWANGNVERKWPAGERSREMWSYEDGKLWPGLVCSARKTDLSIRMWPSSATGGSTRSC